MGDDLTSCCFTGYRPQKFPFSLNREDDDYVAFENRLSLKILELIKNGCVCFYTGMAMGFDIIAAETVLSAREIFPQASVKLICAVPFKEQPVTFPNEWKRRYRNILENCDDIILVSDRYFPSCYMKRNKYMVDNSDCVLCYFDGQKGGTKSTVDYAKERGRAVINLINE